MEHPGFAYFKFAEGFEGCFYFQQNGTLAFYTHESNHAQNNKIRVGVLGTCFSRQVFHSSSYFNPDYKRFYDCVYTQFHSSIISLASGSCEGLVKLGQEFGQNKLAAMYFPTEIKKEFFRKLEESGAEYLIIDNYVDAVRPIIRFAPEIYLTYNMFFQGTNLIRQIKDCEIIRPGTEEYFRLYAHYADIFVKEVSRILPQNHMVLLQSRFGYRKIDETTNTISDWPNGYYIRNNNLNWEKVDNLLIKAAPEMRVIDMTAAPWLCDVHTPIGGGASPSHLQRGYYREVLDRLNKIVLEDRLNLGRGR